MCTPCALRQKIGFIKKTEELVRFFGPVVSGHWVMWRDGEGLGLEDWGGAGQRQSGEDNTPTQEHITHTDMSLTGHTVFALPVFYSENRLCLWRRAAKSHDILGTTVRMGGDGFIFLPCNQFDILFVLVIIWTGSEAQVIITSVPFMMTQSTLTHANIRIS